MVNVSDELKNNRISINDFDIMTNVRVEGSVSMYIVDFFIRDDTLCDLL